MRKISGQDKIVVRFHVPQKKTNNRKTNCGKRVNKILRKHTHTNMQLYYY